MSNEADQAALRLWNEVLEAMPSELHSRHALVEARRRLIGRPDCDELSEVLDALAVEAFGPNQIADIKRSDPAPSGVAELSESEVFALVVHAIGDGFSAPTDGSVERAQVLKQRAIGNAERVIEEHRKSLSWFARRRLRKAAQRAASEEMKVVLLPPRTS